MSRYIAELEQIHVPIVPQARPASSMSVVVPRWRPPPEECTKLNVNPGISHDHDVGAAVAICRDRDGTYLGSLVLVIRSLLDLATVEAIACREALALADDLGIRHPFVAPDCKLAVDYIQKGRRGNCEGTIKETRDQENTFISCNFIHESRDLNIDAHRLARFGVSLTSGRHVWLGNPHDPLVITINT